MDKRLELLEKFKDLEKKLCECLKTTKIEEKEAKNELATKTEIKAYIKKVQRARKIFDEYELVAKEIENLSDKKNTKLEISENIVNLRDAEEKTEIVYETKIDSNNNARVEAKKKSKKIVKEF